MPIVIFLLMNTIVIASAFIITYKLLRISNFVDSLTCCFIFYLAQIVVSELVLGVLGILYLKNIILLNLGILLIIRKVAKNNASSFDSKPAVESVPGLLKNKIILLGACVILCFGVTKIMINLFNPPFGWDSLNYHFTFPVEWLKHGNLDNPITVSDDPSPAYYPINGSLFFLWLILPFKSVFLADLGQAPFFILAILATYSIARKFNLSAEFSLYAAMLFSIIPNFFKQLQIAYVDVMVAALFLTCLSHLFLLREDFSLPKLLIFSVSLGLFVGTKTIALPYSVLLFLPFVCLMAKHIDKSYFLIIAIFAIVILGGFSYIRNFTDTGNPLYPLDLRIFGKPILKGVMDTHTYRAHFKIEDYRISKLLFHEGLGLATSLFILPSVFLALPLTLVKRIKSLNLNLAYFFILPILLYLIYRYVIPLANTRYLYPLLGTGIILGFYTVRLLNIPKRIVDISAFICILASMAELAKRQELVISIILTCLLFFLSLVLTRHKPKMKIKKPLFIPITITSLIILLALLQVDYIKNEYPRYIKMAKYSGFWPDATIAWDWLNTNTQGNNIAYVGRPVPFPLYGTNFKNNVYYVSVNKIEPAKLHHFPDSNYRWDDDFLRLHRNLEAQGNYRGDADRSVWLNNLSKRNIDYLFIYSLHQTKDIIFPLEDSWAKTNAQRFNPIFTNATIHIYKIIR